MRSVALKSPPITPPLAVLGLVAATLSGCGAAERTGERARDTSANPSSSDPSAKAGAGASASPSAGAAQDSIASASAGALDGAASAAGASELREAGVVVTFPTAWSVEPVRGGFIGRDPGGTGAMALVGGVESDAINDARHVLEKEAGALFPIGLGQRTMNANGYPFFITNEDLVGRGGIPIRVTTGMSAAAAGVGVDTQPLVLMIWFRRDALETVQAVVKAIDTIEVAPRTKAERQKASPP